MNTRRENLLHWAIFILFFIMALLFIYIRHQAVLTNNVFIWPQKKITLATSAPSHVPKPAIVRGIYLTAYSAGNDKFRQKIINQMTRGRINSVVIDIKDYSGYILYKSNLITVKNKKAINPRLRDVSKILDDFHRAGIYVIARQTVFQDPVLAISNPELAFHDQSGNIWQDRKELAWIDPGQKPVWDYNLAIAKEAVELGFDEINFDYMRYPSDGDIADLNYNLPKGQTKTAVMKNFFVFLDENLKNVASTSIDMLGLVMDNTKSGYDLGIGQRLFDAADYFDYVCPMMYASHYNINYMNFDNAAEHPGEIVANGLDLSREAMKNKRAKIRPWLQAFNLGAVYDEAMIDQETRATEKATSTDGWLLWNASNVYPDYIF